MAALGGSGLELYLGLSKNPFSSISILDMDNPLELFVPLQPDEDLGYLVDEALRMVGSAFVAITGPPGSGRSIRLEATYWKFSAEGGTPILYEVSPIEGPDAIDDVLNTAYGLSRGVKRALKKALLGADELSLKELEEIRISPARAGETLAGYLESVAPAALLLDDVHNMMFVEPRWSFFFFEMIRELVSIMGPGMLVAMTCSEEAFARISRRHPALISRLHERIRIPLLSDKDAVSLVSKRIEMVRTREPEWPLDPFEEEAVALANRIAAGNPKKLMELLSKVVDAAVVLGRTRIDAALVSQVAEADRPILRVVERAPERMRREMEVILRKFEGGPVSLEKVAMETEVPPQEEWSRLEALVAAGLLAKDESGRYYVPRSALESKEGKSEEKRREKKVSRSVMKIVRMRAGSSWRRRRSE